MEEDAPTTISMVDRKRNAEHEHEEDPKREDGKWMRTEGRKLDEEGCEVLELAGTSRGKKRNRRIHRRSWNSGGGA